MKKEQENVCNYHMIYGTCTCKCFAAPLPSLLSLLYLHPHQRFLSIRHLGVLLLLGEKRQIEAISFFAKKATRSLRAIKPLDHHPSTPPHYYPTEKENAILLRYTFLVSSITTNLSQFWPQPVWMYYQQFDQSRS